MKTKVNAFAEILSPRKFFIGFLFFLLGLYGIVCYCKITNQKPEILSYHNDIH